jgi:hypothetical protein
MIDRHGDDGSSCVAVFERFVCNVGDADCGCSAPGPAGLKEITVTGVCAEVEAGERGFGGKVNNGLPGRNGVGGSLLDGDLVFGRADDSGILDSHSQQMVMLQKVVTLDF